MILFRNRYLRTQTSTFSYHSSTCQKVIRTFRRWRFHNVVGQRRCNVSRLGIYFFRVRFKISTETYSAARTSISDHSRLHFELYNTTAISCLRSYKATLWQRIGTTSTKRNMATSRRPRCSTTFVTSSRRCDSAQLKLTQLQRFDNVATTSCVSWEWTERLAISCELEAL